MSVATKTSRVAPRWPRPEWTALTALCALMGPVEAKAQDEEIDADAWGEFAESVKNESDGKIFDTRFYGYIDAYVEKVADTPQRIDENGNSVFASNPHEFDVLNLHAFVQGSIYNRFRYFLNLAAPGSGGIDDNPLGVRNAWVEVGLWGQYVQVRAGKTYRRFGLYNEILDAVPTFIGVEPPELFDNDHLFLSRTTNLMMHGSIPIGSNNLGWSVATGNDERGGGGFPLGADLRFTIPGTLTAGSSFYYSSDDAVSTVALGEGSPRGGVKPWIANDEYYVVGGFLEANISALLFQVAYWQAIHDGTRDPDALQTLAAEAGLNQRQLERFFEGGDPMATPRLDASYDTRTFYVRSGYSLNLPKGIELIPYAQFDYFDDPEAIANKDFGGDNEAGLSDDGIFYKVTVGTVFRPIPQVALKVDGSAHIQEFNNETVFYPEIRASLSYLWELEL